MTDKEKRDGFKKRANDKRKKHLEEREERFMENLDAMGNEMAEDYNRRPQDDGRDSVVCSTFIMLEMARMTGTQRNEEWVTNCPEESWVLANTIVNETELGLNDSPVGRYEDMIMFVQQWSEQINAFMSS